MGTGSKRKPRKPRAGIVCWHCNAESTESHYVRVVDNKTPLYGPWAGWRMAGRDLVSPDGTRIDPQRLSRMLWIEKHRERVERLRSVVAANRTIARSGTAIIPARERIAGSAWRGILAPHLGGAMDREEPRMGNDLSEVEFRDRRPRHVRPTPAPRDNLVWKIAGGVLLGLVCFSFMQSCSERMQQQMAIEQFNAEMEKLSKPGADPPGWRAEAQRQQAAAAAAQRRNEIARMPRPLSDDERCVDHQRLQRLSNGWKQLPGRC